MTIIKRQTIAENTKTTTTKTTDQNIENIHKDRPVSSINSGSSMGVSPSAPSNPTPSYTNSSSPTGSSPSSASSPTSTPSPSTGVSPSAPITYKPATTSPNANKPANATTSTTDPNTKPTDPSAPTDNKPTDQNPATNKPQNPKAKPSPTDPDNKPKPKTQNVESRKNPSSPNKKSPVSPDQTKLTPGNDKFKGAKDPKQFAQNKLKDEAAKFAAKRATQMTMAAAGTTLAPVIGTAVGWIAGELAGFGLEIADPIIKYILAGLGIIVLFFITIIFIVIMGIASFFMTGGGGTSIKVDNGISGQITPIDAPTDIPTGAKTLDKPKDWYQAQAPNLGGCQATSIAMYLTFLGKTATEDDILKVNGSNYISFTNINAKYLVHQDSMSDTNDFAQHKDYITKAIDKGKPVIIGVGYPMSSRAGGSHFLVVVGYDANNFFVNDPWNGRPSSRPWSDLEKATYPVGFKYYGYTIGLNN